MRKFDVSMSLNAKVFAETKEEAEQNAANLMGGFNNPGIYDIKIEMVYSDG